MKRMHAHPAWRDRLHLALEAAVFLFGLAVIVAAMSLDYRLP